MKKDRTEKRQFDSSLRSLGSLGLFPSVSVYFSFLVFWYFLVFFLLRRFLEETEGERKRQLVFSRENCPPAIATQHLMEKTRKKNPETNERPKPGFFDRFLLVLRGPAEPQGLAP